MQPTGLTPFMEMHPEAESPFAMDSGEGGVGLLSEPLSLSGSSLEASDPNDPSSWRNIGRNAPCPCGSGKKFKHCHGRLG